MKHALQQQQDLRQLQRLTPMQVQFVRMLEMTEPELESEVSRALDEMPALEIADDRHETHGAEDDFNESAEQVQLADYSSDDDVPSYMLNISNYSPDDVAYTPMAVNDELTLAEDLTRQLTEMSLTQRQLTIAAYIIGNLDANGYLKRTPQAIADDITFAESEDIGADEVKDMIAVIRGLDPAGVAAVDLRDCLLLQLNRRQATVEVLTAREIVRDYFDLFSKKHYERIADMLGISMEALRDAVDVISRLNPKPGNQYNDTVLEESGRLIVPAFQVDADTDGNITVTMLSNIPELAISSTFSMEAPMPASMTPRQRADATTFIRTRRDDAAAFIKTLQMRQTTLFNVMSAIATLQRDFFITGDETKLRPMILKDVAAVTGYDLSVISRATASKYVLTSSGIYPLKFFFNERPKVDDDATSHQIADAIRKIITGENPQSPYPDEVITKMLAEGGFNIARRTVAKYRERLGFPVARLRKKIQ